MDILKNLNKAVSITDNLKKAKTNFEDDLLSMGYWDNFYDKIRINVREFDSDKSINPASYGKTVFIFDEDGVKPYPSRLRSKYALVKYMESDKYDKNKKMIGEIVKVEEKK